MKNRYRKTIAFVSFLFILSFGIFSFAFTSSANNLEGNMASPSFSIYFLATAKSQLESEASVLAKDEMASGNGGYVWQEENYFYVISSAYENKNDATLVSNNLKNEGIKNDVFEISFPSLSFPTTFEKSEEKSTFFTSINLFYSLYKQLFDISICLDTNLYSETQALLEINTLQAKADETMKNFSLLFTEQTSQIFCSLEEAIVDTNETIGMLAEKQTLSPKQNLLSLTRYSYTKILAIYHIFLEKIQ